MRVVKIILVVCKMDLSEVPSNQRALREIPIVGCDCNSLYLENYPRYVLKPFHTENRNWSSITVIFLIDVE